MKTFLFPPRWSGLPVATLALAFASAVGAANSPIPFSEIGAKATADYEGDALAVAGTPESALLRCGFQKLEGRATPQGLWLQSTVSGGGRFRLVAQALNREVLDCGSPLPPSAKASPLQSGRGLPQPKTLSRGSSRLFVATAGVLPTTGSVEVADRLVRFTRPEVTEEYSVSVDGVRQDFVIPERPLGAGDLRVELAMTGARAEAAAYGAKLILDGSGRALAYSRLRATDATGLELQARLEVLSADLLAVRVADGNATYPVRIDPTFSDANWVSFNPGMPGADSDVYAIAVDASGNVFVGGDFAVIGTIVANGVAKWNGSAWSALGAGMDSNVYALAVSGTNLYAGGDFTKAGGIAATNIAQWNGSAWSALGSGMGGGDSSGPYVYALAVSGTNLYVGGDFTTAGGVTANYVATWNGSAWSALGLGMDGYVWALAVTGTTLYAGGSFINAGAVAATNIAKWNGSAWSALGKGTDSYVYALAVSGTTLYAGGDFANAGGVAANYVAKWNGSAWSALGKGMDSDVFALALSGTTLYAAGDFANAGAVTASYIAKWNGSAWSAVGTGMDSDIYALAVSGTTLYAGGDFTMAGVVNGNAIAAWNGSAWSALGSGLDSAVWALAVSGTTLYVGGDFIHAGGVAANYIAKWNGSAWSALGLGMDSDVLALTVSGTTVYAGGDFTTAGGVTVNYIAKWNGSAWSALGSGMDSDVYVLAMNGTTLYAGGSFTNAGSVSANYIAAWNGSAWSALGSGMDSDVYALAVSGTTLYAGGDFINAGGVTGNYIAAWNGSAWSALGSGMDSDVYALAVSGSTLYAGGDFINAGGMTGNHIAAWNGSAWSALGLGMDSDVYTLALSGTTLYAGGSFTNADSVRVNFIAGWNGSAWSPLGSGIGGGSFGGNGPFVYALAPDGSGHLFVGGEFSLAGTNVSPFIAQANIGGMGVSGGRLGGMVYSSASGFSCTFSNATTGQPYNIETSPSLAGGSWTDLTNFTYTGPIVISDPSAAAGAMKFYRAVSP